MRLPVSDADFSITANIYIDATVMRIYCPNKYINEIKKALCQLRYSASVINLKTW